MKTAIVWLLLAGGTGSGATITTVERFATQQDCQRVETVLQREFPRVHVVCVPATVSEK